MPVVLQWATYLVPARYYIDILVGVYLVTPASASLGMDMAVLGFQVLLAAFQLPLKKEGL